MNVTNHERFCKFRALQYKMNNWFTLNRYTIESLNYFIILEHIYIIITQLAYEMNSFFFTYSHSAINYLGKPYIILIIAYLCFSLNSDLCVRGRWFNPNRCVKTVKEPTYDPS